MPELPTIPDTLFPLIFLGLIAFFFVAVVAASLWERRPIQPYVLPEEGSELAPTAKARSANAAAKKIGYQRSGMAHDGKGRIYRVRYDFWTSPDDSTLLVIGGGKIASLPVDGLWLWSRSTDGRIFLTTNEIGEQDISGIVHQETHAGKSLAALSRIHAERLEEVNPVPFSPENPLAGHFENRRSIADALVDRGRAYYTSDEQIAWKYTLKGALTFYFVGTWLRPIGRFLRSIGIKQRR